MTKVLIFLMAHYTPYVTICYAYFRLPYLIFQLKKCSNHGIISIGYFYLCHGHFVHGYYIGWNIHHGTKVAALVLFYSKSEIFGTAPNTP